MPASTMTSASLTLAQQTPTAPISIWRRASRGHLWVLVWGRSEMPCSSAWAAIFARFSSIVATSMSSAGVGMSSTGIGTVERNRFVAQGGLRRASREA